METDNVEELLSYNRIYENTEYWYLVAEYRICLWCVIVKLYWDIMRNNAGMSSVKCRVKVYTTENYKFSL